MVATPRAQHGSLELPANSSSDLSTPQISLVAIVVLLMSFGSLFQFKGTFFIDVYKYTPQGGVYYVYVYIFGGSKTNFALLKNFLSGITYLIDLLNYLSDLLNKI